jgi:hypothetical protein
LAGQVTDPRAPAERPGKRPAALRASAEFDEVVLPFFMFHQTIILIGGWFVVPCGRGPL